MIRKYASTDGWGCGRFIDGKPVDETRHKTCIPCHEPNVKSARSGLYAIGALNVEGVSRALDDGNGSTLCSPTNEEYRPCT